MRSRVFPLVQVSIANQDPALFVVDTGSSTSAISRAQAKLWKLSLHDIQMDVIASSGRGSVRAAACVPRLVIGDVVITNINAPIANLPELFAGFLGIDVLSQVAILFDGGDGSVRLLRSDNLECQLGALYPGASWSKLQLQWTAHQSPTVDVAVGSETLRLSVDTGSSSSSITSATVRRLKLLAVRTEKVQTVGATGELVADSPIYKLDGLVLGKWTCEFEDSPADDPVMERLQVDGYLGFDLLGKVPCVFDAKASLLWVQDPRQDAGVRLRSSLDARAIACLRDPLPEMRKFSAISVAKTNRRRLTSVVAGLLTDPSPDVQQAAAVAISTLAGQSWPDATRVAAALAWWEEHREDKEFQAPATE
jgi:predicted aspartyl protease